MKSSPLKKKSPSSVRKRAAARKFKAERGAWRAVKGTAPKRDALRREFCHLLKCVVCAKLGENRGTSECAHVGERGLRQKSSDFETLSLCIFHHRLGPCAHHKLGKLFWIWSGLDRDKEVAKVNRAYEKWLKERGTA